MRWAGIFAAGVLACLALSSDGGWVPYQSAAGRFSVMFPAEPTTVKMPLRVKDEKLTLHAFVHQLPDKFGYAVVYCDLPKGPMAASDPNVVLERFIAAQIKSQGGKLLSQQDTELKGAKGREFSYQTSDGMAALCRAYVVENRIYEAALIGPLQGSPPADYAKFFDSFRIAPGKR